MSMSASAVRKSMVRLSSKSRTSHTRSTLSHGNTLTNTDRNQGELTQWTATPRLSRCDTAGRGECVFVTRPLSHSEWQIVGGYVRMKPLFEDCYEGRWQALQRLLDVEV